MTNVVTGASKLQHEDDSGLVPKQASSLARRLRDRPKLVGTHGKDGHLCKALQSVPFAVGDIMSEQEWDSNGMKLMKFCNKTPSPNVKVRIDYSRTLISLCSMQDIHTGHSVWCHHDPKTAVLLGDRVVRVILQKSIAALELHSPALM
jgi:hypothetical protein